MKLIFPRQSALLLLLLLSWENVRAAPPETNTDLIPQLTKESTEAEIQALVAEPKRFFGLSSYYNNVGYFIVGPDSIELIPPSESRILEEDQWFAVVGRFKVCAIRSKGMEVTISDNDSFRMLRANSSFKIQLTEKNTLSSISNELNQIRYSHLWTPLAYLARIVEASLIAINTHLFSNWGLTIITFSILLKIVLLPVSYLTVKCQRDVSKCQALLHPKLSEIKGKYKNEEAHKRIMQAHKDLGISPFYALKPMLGSLIQIPVLIAVFNALGEMPQIAGSSFLWIKDLTYPDSIFSLPFTIPMLGNSVNILPILMTAVTIIATLLFQNKLAPEAETKKQKKNLYIMSAAFFLLFYPFPAIMVLYWLLTNVLQIVQQQFIKVQ